MSKAWMPRPGVGFGAQMAADVQPPLSKEFSGELKATTSWMPMGAVRKPGQIVAVHLSLAATGKDDTNTLALEGSITVNGNTVCSTLPKVAHVSGEASTNKSTRVAGTAGVTQAVLNATYVDVNPGDVILCRVVPTRTASPTTEMAQAIMEVEITPTDENY